jgi:hypothetical protein
MSASRLPRRRQRPPWHCCLQTPRLPQNRLQRRVSKPTRSSASSHRGGPRRCRRFRPNPPRPLPSRFRPGPSRRRHRLRPRSCWMQRCLALPRSRPPSNRLSQRQRPPTCPPLARLPRPCRAPALRPLHRHPLRPSLAQPTHPIRNRHSTIQPGGIATRASPGGGPRRAGSKPATAAAANDFGPSSRSGAHAVRSRSATLAGANRRDRTGSA